MLNTVGAYKNSVPLIGNLSPKIFHPGSAANLKNEILDSLDFKIDLPKLTVSGIPKTVSFKKSHLEIKGTKDKNNQRGIGVDVTGELDVSIKNQKVAFDYEVDIKKPSGKPAEVSIKGHTEAGRKVTIDLFHPFTLDSLEFSMNKEQAGWKWQIDAKTEFRSKPLDVSYLHDPAEKNSPDGPNHLAITTKMTLAEIVGKSDLPGLDDVQISWIQVYDRFWRASLSAKGTYFYLNIFKPAGASKHLVAVTLGPDTISPAKFIPGTSNTPLKDVDLEGMSFVLAPAALAGQLYRNQMPRYLKWRLRSAWVPGNIILKPGLNVFGKLKVHPAGKVASLLAKVGLPLNGGFSPKAFSKNLSGAAIKNEILDHLDLKVNLPNLAIPGLSNIITFNNAHLAIKGKHTGGIREIDVGVSGELRARMGSREIDFDFDIEGAKAAGASAGITITADSTSTVSLPFIHPLELTSMDLTATRKAGKWKTEVDAKATLNNKPIDVTYIHDAKNQTYVDIKTRITLADLSPIHLPGLTDVEIDEVKISKATTLVKTKIKGVPSQLAVFKQLGSAKHFISLVAETQGGTPVSFSPAQFIPGTAHSPLKDVTFQNMAFVYNPYSFYFQLKGDLPAGVRRPIEHAKVNMSVAPGLNVFGHMKVHPTGEMESLLRKVGVTKVSIPLHGGFSPKAFSKNISGTAIKNAILDKLDLNIKLPPLSVPGVSRFLTFNNGHLKIKGKLLDGRLGIDVGISGDADVHVKRDTVAFKIDVEYDKAGGASDLSFKGSTEKKWTHPLGIDFLVLDTLTVDIDKKKQASGDSTFEIKMSAKTDIGSRSRLDVTVDVHEKNGTVTDAFFELDGPLKLSEIPGVKDIPNASHFTLDTIKISEHGIEAKTTLAGRATDIALFTGSGWTAAITQKNFTITELIPPLKKTPLKHIGFPSATLLISDGGIDKHFGDLGPIAQDALKVLGTAPGALVQIASGITFAAGFHPDNAGAMKNAVRGIGVHEGVMLQGTIGGVFGGGTPMVKLKGTLASAGKPGSMPKFMKFAKNAELEFFINVLESGEDFDFELGLGVGVHTKIHGDNLLFDSKVKLQVMEEGFGIDIEGQMLGTWHKPFGIPFTIGDLTLEVGTQEDGAVKLGFAGTTIIGADKFSMAGDGEFLPEALGAPQAFAFKATADEVDLLFLDEVAIKMVSLATNKAGVHLPINKIPQPKIKKAMFAFATPGAEDPDLGLVSEGFALKGNFFFLGHKLGSVNAAVGPTSGISIKGNLDNFDLGPLKLKNNNLKIKVPFKKLPAFHIHSNIAFLGISEKFLLDATSKTITFHAQATLGPDFIADFDLALRGLDLNSATVDPKTADFYMKGTFEAKLASFIRDSAKKTLHDVFNELGQAFTAGEAAVAAAKTKVEGLQTQVNAERAVVRKEKAAAEAKVQDAENRVNSLNGSLTHAWSKYHGCHGWGKYACKVKYGLEIAGLKGSIKVADGILNEAKSAIKHFPVDLDPRVAALIILKDAALVALDAAKLAIEGLDDLDKFLSEGLADLVAALNATGAGAAIEINEASFEGDLRGVIEHDAPLDLALKAKVFGAPINEKFAFKMKDIAWSGEQLGLMGLYALEHLIENLMSDLPASLRHHARSAVGRKIDATTASRNRALAAAQADFAKQATMAKATVYADESTAAIQKKIAYNQHAAALQAKYAAQTDAYIHKLLAERDHNPLDNEGASLTYTNDFFEVGHTGLCLTNIGGEIRQHPCKQDKADSQKWTTVAVTEKDGSNQGYVQMTQSGQCASPAGKYVTVTKTFGDNYTYQGKNFQGDGTLSMGNCFADKVYHWKIFAHGTDWVRMINRVTSHCIHFENSNALPGAAKGVWGPCMGTANQVYRVAGNLTPIYHKAGFALRNDFNSLCLGDGTPDVPMVTCDKPARYDYMVDVRGFIKFVNVKTGMCLQPQNYTLKTSLTEKTCSQLDYQWWKIVHVPGGWSVKNAQTNHCDRVGTKAGDPATQDACTSWSQAILVPLMDASIGVDFTKAPTGKSNFNVNFSPSARKQIYNLTLNQTMPKKIQAQSVALNAAENKLYHEEHNKAQYHECDPKFSPAYQEYKQKHSAFFQWKMYDSYGQKCVPMVPKKTTHIACPPPRPPEHVQVCQYTYQQMGWTKERYENALKNDPDEVTSQLWCKTSTNNAFYAWRNKHSVINSLMREGKTCGPNGTAVNTTGGQRNTNTCPPPFVAPKGKFCQWVFEYIPADKKASLQAKIAKLRAAYQKDSSFQESLNHPPPIEPPQYMCRAKYLSNNPAWGRTFNDLLIGIVRDKKCVYANGHRTHIETTTEYEIMGDVNSVNWIAATRTSRIPQRALALGYVSSASLSKSKHQSPLRSIYACRAISRAGNSTVGWTTNGFNCTYADQGTVHANQGYGNNWRATMEVLVRDTGKVVHLNLAEKP